MPAHRRKPPSPPSRLLIFLPALVVLAAAAVALRLDREVWRREQMEKAQAALTRMQVRFWERLPLSPHTIRMPAGSDGRPAWVILTFPEIPMPQPAEAPLMETLRNGDPETAWNQGAGQLSAAGLPVRLLAWRALALRPGPQDPAVLRDRLHTLVWSEPSALVPVILEDTERRIKQQPDFSAAAALQDWKQEWSALTTWRSLYQRHGAALESLQQPQWLGVPDSGTERRLLVSVRTREALDEASVQQLLADIAAEDEASPAIPGLKLDFANQPARGEFLAESQGLPALRATVHDPAAWSSAAWKRTAWLSGFAGLALAGTLWGSQQMLRALRRQAELSRQKSNFIASVSHELRTPLTSLRVLSENLNEGRVGDAEMRASYFPLMVDECRRLGALVENVLEFARAEDGRSRFQFAETDVAAMTADTVKLVRPRAEQCGLHLETVLPSLPEPVTADAMSLHRALLNLLDNAIKFTPSGGRITVTLRHEKPGWWSLSVQDTGPGIPREEHSRVFERFYRTGSELTRTVPGTGIGLSIVQHLAEGHSGRVSLTSSPGHGAVFTLHLPYQPPPPQTRPQQS